MIKSTASNDRALVDKKIDEFCKSSAQLLESIHARYGGKSETMSSRRNRKEKKKKADNGFSISDLAGDFLEEEPLDSGY
jgi:hypothetical protein